MDSTRKFNNPNPEASANIISRIFFWWTVPFFKYGYKNDVQAKDLYNATEKDTSEKLGDILEREWYAEVERSKRQKGTSKPDLMVAIRKAFIKPYSVHGLMLLFQSVVIKMLQPFALLAFIKYFHPHRPQPVEYGWLLATAVVALAGINILIMHYCQFEMQRIGMRCRIACCSLIYRKLLRLNRVSIGQVAAGQLVNLLSNDVSRFDESSMYLHYIWLMPVQAIVGTIVMYEIVGVAAFAGIAALIVQAIPLQGYLSKKQGDLRYKIAKQTDFRVKLMSEITSSMQVIKMYAWEKPFEKMVHLARKKEINVVEITSYIKGVSIALMVFTERVTLFLTIVAFVLLGNDLTGEIIFSVAQLFNTLQLYIAIFYPMAITFLAEAKISVKRIEEFLIKDENPPAITESIPEQEKLGTIKLTKVKASWQPNPIVDTLSNIDLTIKPGTLCVVVGQVGSGKSSLLQLLLNELPVNSGKLEVIGKTSFASQEPWLFVSTVKDNILFGEEFDKSRYKEVVKVCALEKDFEQLPNGDRTFISEKGVSLSGGQRARINLARAVYRDADVYLMDDPLSAVDAHVGKHLFQECLMKYLKGKTRILTTHQLQFLRQADLVVIMNNGQIQKVGTFSELSENELQHLRQEEQQEEVKTPEVEQRQRLMSVASHTSTIPDDDEIGDPTETEELIEKGSISKSVYSEYMKAGGTFLVCILVFILLLAQGITNASDIWLTYWTNEEVEHASTNMNNTNNRSAIEYNSEAKLEADSMVLENASDLFDFTTTTTELPDFGDRALHEQQQRFYINIYTALIVGAVILNTARSLLFFKITMRASKGLHDTMFNNILQATMRFFDTNPSGRILNRFSKDIGAVDEILPKAFLQTLQIFLVGAGILVMAFIITPWLIVPTAIVTVMFYYTRKVYLASAQNVKRLEGTTKAPLFSHLSASLYGISTIRCFNTQPLISKEFDVLQDQHTGAWFLFIATSEAFGLCMDLISVLYLTIVTFQFLIFDDGSTSGGNVGLIISQCLILTGMTQYGVRQSAEVASQMTSVERVLQYTKLDKEGPFESLPANRPGRDWPKNGNIAFEKVFLRYVSTEAPVLKNLNISIKAGEKIGIVGRTGAGKSSLISALFRLAPIEGRILIDNVDTSTIGLHDLRKQISIIPQEPVLFSATIRYNLDPFGKSDDKTLWDTLEKVELKEAVPSLDHAVAESGSNFSAGQRQLMCLARAIIRDNKILVMDEATANVDPQTDSLIQATIRRNFKDCTVLTIAHRLNTVMDSDKVLVMSAGEALEFDAPHKLLQNPNGHFTSMVKETGRNMENKLREIALQAFVDKEEESGSVHELTRIDE